MCEENKEFDPRDLNKDGKVSLDERIRAAAGKAEEAFGAAAGAVKGGVDRMVEKVKDYKALSPEEKKAKEEEWNRKATDLAGKASDKAKEIAVEVKEKLFGKKEAEEN